MNGREYDRKAAGELLNGLTAHAEEQRAELQAALDVAHAANDVWKEADQHADQRYRDNKAIYNDGGTIGWANLWRQFRAMRKANRLHDATQPLVERVLELNERWQRTVRARDAVAAAIREHDQQERAVSGSLALDPAPRPRFVLSERLYTPRER